MNFKIIIIAIFMVISTPSNAHYSPNMEKAIVEVSDYCSGYMRNFIDLFAEMKSTGYSQEHTLSFAKTQPQQDLVRALFQSNPTTTEQLDNFRTEQRRQCVVVAANKINKLYKIPTGNFTQEESDSVRKIIVKCRVLTAFRLVLVGWKADGIDENEALELSNNLGMFNSHDEAAHEVAVFYGIDTSSFTEDTLDLIEGDCIQESLELMVNGANQLPE